MLYAGIEFHLEDEGTLDTVISWVCPECETEHTERFSLECAAPYRNQETGAFELEGFREFIESEYDYFHCDCWE